MRDDERAVEDGELPESGAGESTEDEDLVVSYAESGKDDFEESDDEMLDEAGEDAVGETSAAAAPSESQSPPPPAFMAPVFNNFMDALYPAKAPVAKNARIIRRFDLEAAKYDPRPSSPAPMPAPAPVPEPAAAAAAPQKKAPALTREEQRALRNRSLRAAAGLD